MLPPPRLIPAGEMISAFNNLYKSYLDIQIHPSYLRSRCKTKKLNLNILPPPRLHPCRRDDQRAQPPAGHHAGRHQADDRQGEVEQQCQQSQSLKSWKKRNTVSLKLNEAIMLGERYPLSLFMLCRFISSQVDRDGDGRISYSEFRVMMGANPLIIS